MAFSGSSEGQVAQKMQKQAGLFFTFFSDFFQTCRLKWERGQVRSFEFQFFLARQQNLRLVSRIFCLSSSEGQSLHLFPFLRAAQTAQSSGSAPSLRLQRSLSCWRASRMREWTVLERRGRVMEKVLLLWCMKTLTVCSRGSSWRGSWMRLCLVASVSRDSCSFIDRSVIIQNNLTPYPIPSFITPPSNTPKHYSSIEILSSPSNRNGSPIACLGSCPRSHQPRSQRLHMVVLSISWDW